MSTSEAKKEIICAAIVEPRKHKAFQFVVQNMRQVLPDAVIHVFHGSTNDDFVREQCQNQKDVEFHKMKKRNLNLSDYNLLLCQKEFYEHFQSEYVLVFQTDSMLFSQSPYMLTDFFGYDYVGAPWKWKLDSPGGNGGLSLRKVATFLDVLEKHKYPLAIDVAEDIFFSSLPLKFPPLSVAERFSVESHLTPTPFGCHKPWLYLTMEEYIQFYKYAPQVKSLFDLQ